MKVKSEVAGRFKASCKASIDSAFGEVWRELLAQIRRNVYATMRAYKGVEIDVVDNCGGETWFKVDLKQLATDFIRDAGDDTDYAEFLNNAANDFEKQAKRLRKHAKMLKSQLG